MTFAESTSKIDNNGRTLLCGRANVLEVSGTVTVRGLCLCLNDSWLVERVRGSRFRAARQSREDFAKADRQLRENSAGFRCLPAGVATTSNSTYIDSKTKLICLAPFELGRASDCRRRARREHEPDTRSFEDARSV